MIAQIIFSLFLGAGIYFFARKIREVNKLISLGQALERKDRIAERWKTMFRVAMGQSKMGSRPVAAFFHLIIYLGFIIINIEVLEIIADGLFGTHRLFAPLGVVYDFLIASFEILAFLVLLACVVFLSRRNIYKVRRFTMEELKAWPRQDANIILVTEIFLMSAFLLMNAADQLLQTAGHVHYVKAGLFPISSMLTPLLSGWSVDSLVLTERALWWFHILGILAFLNYVPYSKHFHILLAFPNTFYAKLEPSGKLDNLLNVSREVKLAFDPSATITPEEASAPDRFGARDATDLNWKQLMDAFS
ncbi:MAG: Fe-S oxidoreductase, partial [Bacteroidota bacterium]